MRNVRILGPLFALLLVLSCGKSSTKPAPVPPVDDTPLVLAALSAAPELADDAIYPTGTIVLADSNGSLATSAAIAPRTFRRSLHQIDRFNNYTWSDSDAAGRPRGVVVMLCKYEKGTLAITTTTAPPDSAPSDTTVEKRLQEDWFRYVRLARTGEAWAVTAVSSVLLFGNDVFLPCDTCRSTITSVRMRTLSAPLVDTTITSVLTASWTLRLRDLEQLPHVYGGQLVEVTAVTTRDDDVVVLHVNGGWRRFRHTGMNTYTIEYVVQGGWLQNALVSVMGRKSLEDDAWPNDHMLWGLPLLGPIPIPLAGTPGR